MGLNKIPTAFAISSQEFKTANFAKEVAMTNLKLAFGFAHQSLIALSFCVCDQFLLPLFEAPSRAPVWIADPATDRA